MRELPQPLVFDTGQALQGLIRAYEESADSKYLEAALKAGEWIIKNQDADGKWSRFAYNGVPHVYYAYVAWPLVQLATVTSARRFEVAARKNLDWAMTKQSANGWLADASFAIGSDSVTHTIAYTVQGLLECGIMLGDTRYVAVAERTAEAMLTLHSARATELSKARTSDDLLPATFDEAWQGTANYSCLTGNAQVALIWAKLYALAGDARFLNHARALNQALKQLQSTISRNRGIAGAVKGSHPIWGAYMSFCYPAWAAKFFVDSLLWETACSALPDRQGLMRLRWQMAS